MSGVVTNAENPRDNINEDERLIRQSALHGALFFLMQVLGSFLQIKYQGQGEIITIFQSHPVLVYTFVLVLSMYAIAMLASYEPRMHTYHSTLGYTAFLLGALAITILLFMLELFLSWIALTIWVLIFVHGVYNYMPEFFYFKVKEMFDSCTAWFVGAQSGEEFQLPQ